MPSLTPDEAAQMSRRRDLDLVLVRHGQSGANDAGELVGRRDVPLTALGATQAAETARYLTATVRLPALVVTSPLRRAADTAAAIAAALEAPLVTDGRFVEIDYGDLEGTRFADQLDSWPPDWLADPQVPVPGGESYAEMADRVEAALASACEAADNLGSATLVVVTHLGPVKTIIAAALGGAETVLDRLFVGHGRVTRLRIRGGTSVIESMNVQPRGLAQRSVGD
jgi:broad specificity phosphatase PhoE